MLFLSPERLQLLCACFLKSRRETGGKLAKKSKQARACYARGFILRVFCAYFARDCSKQKQDVLISHGTLA